jgi:hypothetical protein
VLLSQGKIPELRAVLKRVFPLLPVPYPLPPFLQYDGNRDGSDFSIGKRTDRNGAIAQDHSN